MTRFARAKGSKASNERLPNEPTPWHVMKQQLEDAVSSKEHQQKAKSAKELLDEKDDPYYCTTAVNVNHDWAEFEPQEKKTPKKDKIDSADTPSKKNKKKARHSAVEEKENDSNVAAKSDIPVEDNSTTVQENTEMTPKPSKKSKKRKSDISIEDSSKKEEVTVEEILSTKKKMKKDRSSSQSNISDSENPTNQTTEDPKEIETDEVTGSTEGPSVKLSKRQKRNRKNKIKNTNSAEASENSKQEDKRASGAFNAEGNDWSSNVKFGNQKKPKPVDKSSDSSHDQPENNFQNRNNPPNPRENGLNKPEDRFNNQKPIKKRKPPKVRDDKEHKRRKPNPAGSKVIINGLEVVIVMYDGFPVKKEDADRLIELRKQMVMKGIPKSEIDAAMKLERRKAEKALTRIKKNVCFHCRKAGHNLSDCPELGKEESATGICFKCGSTEHTHFECKVNKKEEFRFASCFICREQGHIAKQCPDNPKGLYPQGGSCKICGDVTHLKKDCPDLVKEKEENTMTLNTLTESGLESLEDVNSVKKGQETSEKSKSKVVKF